jgi:cation transport ATPase
MLGEIIIITLVNIILLSILIFAIIWDKLCAYFHSHYTYFKILFVIFYFLEQAIFIGVSYLYREKPIFYPVMVGFFALVVLTTVTLQGIMMESINKKSSDKLNRELINSSEERAKLKLKYENQATGFIGYIEHLESIIDNKE